MQSQKNGLRLISLDGLCRELGTSIIKGRAHDGRANHRGPATANEARFTIGAPLCAAKAVAKRPRPTKTKCWRISRSWIDYASQYPVNSINFRLACVLATHGETGHRCGRVTLTLAEIVKRLYGSKQRQPIGLKIEQALLAMPEVEIRKRQARKKTYSVKLPESLSAGFNNDLSYISLPTTVKMGREFLLTYKTHNMPPDRQYQSSVNTALDLLDLSRSNRNRSRSIDRLKKLCGMLEAKGAIKFFEINNSTLVTGR